MVKLMLNSKFFRESLTVFLVSGVRWDSGACLEGEIVKVYLLIDGV